MSFQPNAGFLHKSGGLPGAKAMRLRITLREIMCNFHNRRSENPAAFSGKAFFC